MLRIIIHNKHYYQFVIKAFVLNESFVCFSLIDLLCKFSHAEEVGRRREVGRRIEVKTGFSIFCNFSSYVWIKKSITPTHDGESRKNFRSARFDTCCTMLYYVLNSFSLLREIFA